MHAPAPTPITTPDRVTSAFGVALRRIRWSVVWRLELLGSLYYLGALLVDLGEDNWTRRLVASTIFTAVLPLAALVAAHWADECVQRGRPAWRSYLLGFVAASGGLALLELLDRSVLGIPIHGPFDAHWANAAALGVSYWIEVSLLVGLGLLLFYNRRASERMLMQLHEADLRRLRLERELVASRLAIARDQLAPETVLERIAGVRELYEHGHAGADAAMTALIEELRLRRAGLGRLDGHA